MKSCLWTICAVFLWQAQHLGQQNLFRPLGTLSCIYAGHELGFRKALLDNNINKYKHQTMINHTYIISKTERSMFGDNCILLCVHVFGVYIRPKKWCMLIFNGGSLIHFFLPHAAQGPRYNARGSLGWMVQKQNKILVQIRGAYSSITWTRFFLKNHYRPNLTHVRF